MQSTSQLGERTATGASAATESSGGLTSSALGQRAATDSSFGTLGSHDTRHTFDDTGTVEQQQRRGSSLAYESTALVKSGGGGGGGDSSGLVFARSNGAGSMLGESSADNDGTDVGASHLAGLRSEITRLREENEALRRERGDGEQTSVMMTHQDGVGHTVGPSSDDPHPSGAPAYQDGNRRSSAQPGGAAGASMEGVVEESHTEDSPPPPAAHATEATV